MDRKPRIAVVGSVHMDMIAHSAMLPEKASSVIGNRFVMQPGGKGGHQAVQCAAAGADTFMITQFGDDDFGRSLLAFLTSSNVDCSAVTRANGLQTGSSTVLSAPEGYTSTIYPGAAAAMTPDDVKSRVKQIAPFDMLILQLELPLELSVAAAHAAKSLGATVVLNAAPSPAMVTNELKSLLQVTSLIVVNESEARAVSGAANAALLASQIGGSAVITLGSVGSEASDGNTTWKQVAIPVDVKNTVGAGDAFLAGLCISLCRGAEMKAALQFAAEAAAKHLAGSH